MLDCHGPGLAMQGRAAAAVHARTGAPRGEDFPSVHRLSKWQWHRGVEISQISCPFPLCLGVQRSINCPREEHRN